MSDPIIRVENLSKTYRIGAKEVIPTGALGTVKQMLKSPFKYLASTFREPAPDEMIWALKDVSFEVYPGEVVGIIGRNGAGKSTLLKILSRITKPTSGFAEIRGRVASLLEVGTGFHPELTGRENVYLNGTILGMTKGEVDAKFDEIVEFSGVEKFIDTPVKRYSSGMQVRLAFAVAAHLEPEILIVDEVLAVGDAEFQQKCLGQMQHSANQEGKAVLFVSHQLDAVKRLCPNAILLRSGKIESYSSTHDIISQYMMRDSVDKNGEVHFQYEYSEMKNSENYPIYIKILDNKYRISSHHLSCNSIFIEISYIIENPKNNPKLNLHIHSEQRVPIFASIDNSAKTKLTGELTSVLEIPGNLLNVGTYLVDLYISSFIPTRVHFSRESVISFTVFDGFTKELRQGFDGRMPGFFVPLLSWKSERT